MEPRVMLNGGLLIPRNYEGAKLNMIIFHGIPLNYAIADICFSETWLL